VALHPSVGLPDVLTCFFHIEISFVEAHRHNSTLFASLKVSMLIDESLSFEVLVTVEQDVGKCSEVRLDLSKLGLSYGLAVLLRPTVF